MPQALIRQSHKFSFREWCFHRTHALLGAYCLTHYVYRFGIFLGNNVTKDMGFELLTTREIIAIFFPHLMLQISGFAFDIPQKRYRDGFRIWPQYRYEALIFCCRSLVLMSIAWYRSVHGCSSDNNSDEIGTIPSCCSVWPPAMAVMAASFSADIVTAYFNFLGKGSSTLRDVNAPPGAMYLAAAAQFHANVHCLLIVDRLCVQLAALAVVQITAFFMTLRRKGIVSVPQGILLYGILLIIGMAIIVRDLVDRGILGLGFTLGNISALVRFDLRLNKYALWTLVALFLQWTSTSGGGFLRTDAVGKNVWHVASIISSGMLIVGAARRQHQMMTKIKQH